MRVARSRYGFADLPAHCGEGPQNEHRTCESIPTRRMPDASHGFEWAGNTLICQKRNDGLVQRLRAQPVGGGLQASRRKWARREACDLANPRIKITCQSDLADGVQRYKCTAQQIVSSRRQARTEPNKI